MNIDTTNCNVVTEYEYFTNLKNKELAAEFSRLYIQTKKQDGKCLNICPEFYLKQTKTNSKKAPILFYRYFKYNEEMVLDFIVYVVR